MITANGQEAEQTLREGVKELAEGIVERSGRWQQVDIKVDQRDSEGRRQDRGQEGRRDGQKQRDPQERHGDEGRQNRDYGNPAQEWAEFRQGV